jgi:hypothetical protein
MATCALDISANVTGSEFLIAQSSFASIPGGTFKLSSPLSAEKGRILGFAPKKRERELEDNPYRGFVDSLPKVERKVR